MQVFIVIRKVIEIRTPLCSRLKQAPIAFPLCRLSRIFVLFSFRSSGWFSTLAQIKYTFITALWNTNHFITRTAILF